MFVRIFLAACKIVETISYLKIFIFTLKLGYRFYICNHVTRSEKALDHGQKKKHNKKNTPHG